MRRRRQLDRRVEEDRYGRNECRNHKKKDPVVTRIELRGEEGDGDTVGKEVR